MAFLIISLPVCFAQEMSLAYDGNGNLVSGDGKYRTYNSLNQLYRVYKGTNLSGTLLQEFEYHPVEERVLVKKTYNGSGSLIETVYYWSKNFITVVNNSGSYNYTYVYHNGCLVAQQNPDGSKLFVSTDHKGNVVAVTNSSGSVVERTIYGPFGDIISGGRLSRFGYEAQEQEPSYGKVPTDGLVSYWSLEGDALDDTAKNNGVVTSAVLTSGNVRDAYRMDGYEDYIRVNDSSSLDLSGNITISAWIYPVEAQQGYIVCKYGSYMIQFLTTNQTQGGIWSSGSWKSFVSGSTPQNTWSHVVFTYDRVIAKLYVNGALVSNLSNTSAADITTHDLFMGARNATYRNRDFNGSIDEVGVWNRALSASEIKQLYDYGYTRDSLLREVDFNARHVIADIGIYGQPDSIVPNVYDPQSLNRYMFERGNSFNKRDDTGHNALAFLGAATFFGAASWYWYTTPIDYDNPDWDGRLWKGLAHGAVAAGVMVLTAPVGISGGAIRVVGPSSGGFAKGVIGGVGAELWTDVIDNTKSTPQQIITTGLESGLSSLVPGLAGKGQYVSTKSFFSPQNYKMLTDVVSSKVVSGGIIAAFNAGLNWIMNNLGSAESKQTGGSSSVDGSSKNYYIGSVKVTPEKTSSYARIRALLGQ